ncbi:hypothetical protein [Streptomyces cinereoruber]
MEPVEEFADIDLTEDEIDAMMARSEPVELAAPPQHPLVEVSVTSTSRTYGSRAYVRRFAGALKPAHRPADLAILT